VPVPEDQLPVELPYIEDFEPDGSGQSPLARCSEFVNTACPRCGAAARRETDVADNFLDSAWYFLRYPSSGRDDVPFDPDLTRKWLPVDMYIGGNEHAVLHLMYTRFVTMALQDMGLVEFGEPFKRFRAHGLLIKEGAKMSKSRGNVINPDRYIDEHGADVLRTYLMFLGPYQRGGDFRDSDIIGIRRFHERLWRYVKETQFADGPPTDPALLKLLHSRVRKVTEHIEGLRYNTAISAVMELLNGLVDARKHHRQCARVLVQLVCPFAPFLAHEFWERLGEEGMVGDAPWPSYDPKLVHEPVVQLAVQVSGRVRARLAVPVDTPEDEVAQAALEHPRVRECIAGRPVERTVVVPNRVVSIAVGKEPEC
jgi:leucyl-tRNA synthetase